MAIFPCGSAIQPAVSGEFYDHPINQSLRFNDDDSAYLSWTPASPGNRKTWTWSGWVKRCEIGSKSNTLLTVNPSGSNTTIRFNSSDQLEVFDYSSGYTYLVKSTAVYRDVSSWYHIAVSVDTTQSTASNRVKLYVNGEQITALASASYPSQNYDTYVNSTYEHNISDGLYPTQQFDGYLAEVHFIDGAAYDASYFGETVSGVWKPIEYTGGYGDNGFYLPFNHDYSVEGFSATTYTGNGSTQYIGGVGFEPDLVWIKERTSTSGHQIFDSIRGATYWMGSDKTNLESSVSNALTSFESDGFTSGNSGGTNESGQGYVAWCWDAGSGSPVSNTDGSITSTVKASTTYGFSIVSYTGTGANATVGHGLNSAPEMVIIKRRNSGSDWTVGHTSIGWGKYLELNNTTASTTDGTMWQNMSPNTSEGVQIGTNSQVNASGGTYIAYCFHSVSGYSKIGSYTGTGSSGNSVTTGFKPAFVMIKRTDSANEWVMLDSVRDAVGDKTKYLHAESSAAESDTTQVQTSFDSNGFTLNTGFDIVNASGGTYIYMAFADKREAAFWLDQSGNNNDFENNNLTESDISLDSPTNNFATLNAVNITGATTYLSEGNLKVTRGDSLGWRGSQSTVASASGKWYAEFGVLGVYEISFGVVKSYSSGFSTSSNQIIGQQSSNEAWGYANNGNKWNQNSSTATGTSFTTGDIVQVAFDADSGKVWFGKNGTWLNSGNPASGTNAAYSNLTVGDQYSFATTINGTASIIVTNFGQDSSFAGSKAPQGNTDDNGYGDFYYAPPTGYLALCTANLTVPDAMNPALDNSPQDYFNTVLYTGNGVAIGSGGQSITGVGFQPDAVWIKKRNAAASHNFSNVISGGNKQLLTDTTDAEITNTERFSTFDADGFTVGGNTNVNNSGDTFVAWNWKANGSGVSNTDGSITSTVSANTDAGFSIGTYTGTSTDGATVGHGLGVTPEMLIVKNRDTNANGNWIVYHKDLTNNGIVLNQTGPQGLHTTWGYPYNPTSTTFQLELGTDGDGAHCAGSYDYVFYAFAGVEGFSKFGSYTGNGSTDGSFIYTGFRPAFVMIKRTDSTGEWWMYDDKREPYNVMDTFLMANSSTAEVGPSAISYGLDFTSNGFKWRSGLAASNGSGGTYIFMAFAENPLKYSTAV